VKKIFVIAALSTVIAAAAAAGEGAASAIADSARVKADVADSAKAKPDSAVSADTAKQDSSASARGEDTSAVSQSADTVAAADTSKPDTSKIDTSAIATSLIADTATALSGDTGTSQIIADNDSLTEEKDKTPLFADSKLFKWVAANIFYILFFGVSILIVAAALRYFLTRKDARRFLTTTRLSVLDKMVQRGCRYIESNYADHELSVDAVARELITGPAYLDALFVKEIGIDVHDFIAQVRVNAIKIILTENPSADIEDACSRSGFKNKPDAERYFKRLCKMEIGEYVKSLNK